mmetsp:Transcript_31993/g.82920  ORF Transcript_31993/g.82920 Transcript_31993/m.82920 type:complete len:293 (-) Transcript_31993:91-969(-)
MGSSPSCDFDPPRRIAHCGTSSLELHLGLRGDLLIADSLGERDLEGDGRLAGGVATTVCPGHPGEGQPHSLLLRRPQDVGVAGDGHTAALVRCGGVAGSTGGLGKGSLLRRVGCARWGVLDRVLGISRGERGGRAPVGCRRAAPGFGVSSLATGGASFSFELDRPKAALQGLARCAAGRRSGVLAGDAFLPLSSGRDRDGGGHDPGRGGRPAGREQAAALRRDISRDELDGSHFSGVLCFGDRRWGVLFCLPRSAKISRGDSILRSRSPALASLLSTARGFILSVLRDPIVF